MGGRGRERGGGERGGGREREGERERGREREREREGERGRERERERERGREGEREGEDIIKKDKKAVYNMRVWYILFYMVVQQMLTQYKSLQLRQLHTW